tara:strand:+ start:99 stop:608 length:510 start_codon:yes stop_codon:yes gene_type:complete
MSEIAINVGGSNELKYSTGLDEKEDKNKSACMYCGGLTFFVLTIGLIGAVVSYYYFGIKFLVDYQNYDFDCKSNIWSYVFISLILSIVLGSTTANNLKNENVSFKVFVGVITSCIWLGIGIWGIIETKNEQCQEVRDTNLWAFAFVISIIQTILGSILSLLWCCVCSIA